MQTMHVVSTNLYKIQGRPTLLDLIISNEVKMAENIEIHAPLGKSDHTVIAFEYVCYSDRNVQITQPQYFRGDYDCLRHYLSEQSWEMSHVVANLVLVEYCN